MLKILDGVMGPVEGVTLALDFANNGMGSQTGTIKTDTLAHSQQTACPGLDPGCICGLCPKMR